MLRWFATHPTAAGLLMALLLLVGLSSFWRLPTEVLPHLGTQNVVVDITYPGADALAIEREALVPVEEALTGMAGVRRLRSEAGAGSGRVIAKLRDTDAVDAALDEISARVARIEGLPPGLRELRVRRDTEHDDVLDLALHGDLAEAELARIGARLERELLASEAISLVEVYGVRERQLNIHVSEQALQRHRLSFEEVGEAVRAGATRTPAGELLSDDGRLATGVCRRRGRGSRSRASRRSRPVRRASPASMRSCAARTATSTRASRAAARAWAGRASARASRRSTPLARCCPGSWISGAGSLTASRRRAQPPR